MELKEVIGRRRSIRFYLPFRPVERSKIQKMLEAARRASCVGNVNNTRAVVIWRDQASPELMKAITPPLAYQQMQTAPVFILWYNETMAYEHSKWLQDLMKLAETRRIGITVERTKQDFQRIVGGAKMGWQQAAVAPLAYMDVGLAVCQAMLVAYDEGLGVCCMGGFRLQEVARLLKLPESAIPVCLMSVGYPAESWEAGGQTLKAPFESLFFEGEYGRPFVEDPAVTEELKREKLIQQPAPLPWREAELQFLARALGLKDTIISWDISQGGQQGAGQG